MKIKLIFLLFSILFTLVLSLRVKSRKESFKQIQHVQSKLCFQIGPSGKEVELAFCECEDKQNFSLIKQEGGFLIKNKKNSMYLNDSKGNVIFSKDKKSQKFEIVKLGEDEIMIKLQSKTYCLNIDAGKNMAGSKLAQAECKKNLENQVFKLGQYCGGDTKSNKSVSMLTTGTSTFPGFGLLRKKKKKIKNAFKKLKNKTKDAAKSD